MVEFPVIFTPSEPIEFEGNVYNRLTFSRPVNFADVLVGEEDFTNVGARMDAVHASMAGVPAGVVAALSISEKLAMYQAVEPILALPPAVGA